MKFRIHSTRLASGQRQLRPLADKLEFPIKKILTVPNVGVLSNFADRNLGTVTAEKNSQVASRFLAGRQTFSLTNPDPFRLLHTSNSPAETHFSTPRCLK